MAPTKTINYTTGSDDAGIRVDRVLAQRFPEYSRTQIQRAADAGLLLVNSTPVKSNHKLAENDVVLISIAPIERSDSPPAPEDIPIEVVYEDTELLVINKPPGMVVHPAAGHRSGTLVNALLGRGTFDDAETERAGGRPGIVHRLDKGTSGLMVVARTETAHRRLAAQLKDRTLTRIYWAICWGHLRKSPVEIDAPIGRSTKDRKKMSVNESGRHAHTTIRVLEQHAITDLIEATLATGRTHQIRVHLSHLGHPVVGDIEYGGGEQQLKGIDPRLRLKAKNMLALIDRPALHAQTIAFTHPETAKSLKFVVRPPADFQSFLSAARQS